MLQLKYCPGYFLFFYVQSPAFSLASRLFFRLWGLSIKKILSCVGLFSQPRKSCYWQQSRYYEHYFHHDCSCPTAGVNSGFPSGLSSLGSSVSTNSRRNGVGIIRIRIDLPSQDEDTPLGLVSYITSSQSLPSPSRLRFSNIQCRRHISTAHVYGFSKPLSSSPHSWGC